MILSPIQQSEKLDLSDLTSPLVPLAQHNPQAAEPDQVLGGIELRIETALDLDPQAEPDHAIITALALDSKAEPDHAIITVLTLDIDPQAEPHDLGIVTALVLDLDPKAEPHNLGIVTALDLDPQAEPYDLGALFLQKEGDR